jgi:hypothetical protein
VIEDEVGNFIESEPVAVVVDNGPNAPLIPDPAEISAPIDGETVRRLVNIEGTASDRFITQSPFREEYQSFFDAGGGQPHFAYYKVEYSPGPEFTKWTLIDEIDIRDVVNDRLVQWETTGLTNGAYALRLRLVFKDGNYTDFQIVVTVDNPPIPQITAAEITEPADGAQLSRRLVVEGTTALHPAEHQFGRYLLEYGPGITPTVWTRLAEGSYSVQDVRLGATRIDDWPNGRYSLRLKVMDQDDVVVVQDQLTFTVDNPPPPTETVVDIATPADQAVIDERARIVGTAALAGDEYRFGRFYLEYGFGIDPTEWFEIRSSPFPEIDTRLGTWDTSEVDDGVYTIRLRVMDDDQTIELEDRVTITVAHQP